MPGDARELGRSASHGSHHVITGSPDQVVHTLEDFRKSGLEHLALSFRDVRLFKDETPDLLLKQMRLFAREIMPAFRT